MHILLIVILTILTQLGGLVYLMTLVIFRRKEKRRQIKRLIGFSGIYLGLTFLIVPLIAPLFGREKIKDSESLKAHSFFYKLANRNYVRPELNQVLNSIAEDFEKQHDGTIVEYLDASFPFADGFPLLPHLSHNDGKKIDLSLVYEEPKGDLTNRKPSLSGYGVYEGPRMGEYDQIEVCKNRGSWQYDFPKYLTLGRINSDIAFSEKGTRDLINTILRQKQVGKLFIEPHLKTRLKLNNDRIRFHGCQAVRHDDHIHFQLR